MIIEGSEWGAQQWLELTRMRCERLSYIATVMSEGGEPRKGGGAGSGSGTSDPTASKALARIEQAERMTYERERLEECVGLALKVVEGARMAIGDKYADTIDAYYITGDKPTWADVAHEMGCSERTCYIRRDVFCDWMEDVGIDRAIAGEFT